MRVINFKIIIVFLAILVGSLPALFAQETGTRNIDTILSDIRKGQGSKSNDPINPDKVSPALLAELGDSVMDQSIGNPERHEYMDRMMGGEGSASLASMHETIGYNYLIGNTAGSGDGTGKYRGPNNRNYGPMGGPYMMWNGYGMTGWGYGGWIMIFFSVLLAVIIAGVGIFVVRRGKGAIHGSPTQESGLDILKKRYAKGAISKEDFDRMKKDLIA